MQKSDRPPLKSLGLALILSLPGAGAVRAAALRDTNITLTDPRPFKCICYSGYRDGQAPGQSEPSESQVREDLILLKKFTHEIRTYGSGKGTHGNFIPKLADEIGLSVHLGIWLDDTYSDAANLGALRDAFALIREGHKSIKSVIVGNEYMFRVRNIDKRPVAPAMARLLGYVKMVRDSIPADIPITSADTWSDVNSNSDEFIGSLDYVIWHTHPWWENQSIASAVGYVAGRYKIIQDKVAKVGGKPLVLGETGWPTMANNGAAVGSPSNQFQYFKDLTAWGFRNNAEFWSFTAFDESWKGAEGAVGAHWGLWYTNRQPLPIISGVNTLAPAYMWSENPDITTSVRLPASGPGRVGLRAEGARPMDAIDALGRNLEALERAGNPARTMRPARGSRGLFIIAN